MSEPRAKVSPEDIDKLRRLAERQLGGPRGQQVRENPHLTTINAMADELRALREVAAAALKLERAMEDIDCHCRGDKCVDVCRALRKAGY